MRRTTTWALLLYATLVALGTIVPSLQWLWPGPLAFTLQIWSAGYLWALIAATAVVLAVTALLVDRWKSSPSTIAQAITRAFVVDSSCLVVISFLAWNIGVWRGGVIGE